MMKTPESLEDPRVGVCLTNYPMHSYTYLMIFPVFAKMLLSMMVMRSIDIVPVMHGPDTAGELLSVMPDASSTYRHMNLHDI